MICGFWGLEKLQMIVDVDFNNFKYIGPYFTVGMGLLLTGNVSTFLYIFCFNASTTFQSSLVFKNNSLCFTSDYCKFFFSFIFSLGY